MSLTPTIPNPQQLQQSSDAMASPNVAQTQIQNPQVPVAHPGMVKATLMNFFHGFGESALHQAGLPTMYERQRQAQLDQNATLQAQSKAALEQAQATQIGGKNETERYKADQKYAQGLNTANAALSKTGYQLSRDADGNTVMVPIAPEQLSEEAKTEIGFKQAKIQYNDALSAKARADADVKMNPNNPTFIQKQKEIEAKLAMAQQNLLLRAAGEQRQKVQFGINNGVMPDGSTPTVVGNGQLLGDNNQPIGKNFQTLNAPTAATKTAGEQGVIIQNAGKQLTDLISANKGKLGNVDAILNTAFLGTPASDPVSSRIASQVASFAALNPRLHGFKGSQALAEFKKIIGPNYNNPDSMIAGIQGMMSTAGDVSKVGIPKTNANSGSGKGFTFHPLGK